MMEAYWHDDLSEVKNFLAKTEASGKVSAMFLWHQTPDRVGQLWTDAGTLSPLGALFARHTAGDAGVQSPGLSAPSGSPSRTSAGMP